MLEKIDRLMHGELLRGCCLNSTTGVIGRNRLDAIFVLEIGTNYFYIRFHSFVTGRLHNAGRQERRSLVSSDTIITKNIAILQTLHASQQVFSNSPALSTMQIHHEHRVQWRPYASPGIHITSSCSYQSYNSRFHNPGLRLPLHPKESQLGKPSQ
jgi:hypothetical protein